MRKASNNLLQAEMPPDPEPWGEHVAWLWAMVGQAAICQAGDDFIDEEIREAGETVWWDWRRELRMLVEEAEAVDE